MLHWFHNYLGHSGRSMPTVAQSTAPKRVERWIKRYAGGVQNSGGAMRPGRRRTLAVMARALYADAKSRRRAGPAKAPPPTIPPV